MDRGQLASVNHGRPAFAATARPGEFNHNTAMAANRGGEANSNHNNGNKNGNRQMKEQKPPKNPKNKPPKDNHKPDGRERN